MQGNGVPSDVLAACMWDQGTYKDDEVEENWNVLVELYGSQAQASKAVQQVRGTVICPLYTSPALLRESHAALVDTMGDESSEIMAKHPAILTCGDGIRTADPGEVRRLASVREVMDSIPPSAIIGAIVAIVGILIFKIGQIKYGLF